jgi:site-specific DNA recombinase
MLARASKLADACDSGSFASYRELVAALVRCITIAQDQVTIEIGRSGLAQLLLDQEASAQSRAKDHSPVLIKVPVRFRRRGVEAKLVVLSRHPAASEPDTNLVKALVRAHEWWGRIARGEARGIGDIARAERFNRAYVTRFLCLAFLAPEITRAILERRQPTELTAKRMISSSLKIPLVWADQAAFVACVLRP